MLKTMPAKCIVAATKSCTCREFCCWSPIFRWEYLFWSA